MKKYNYCDATGKVYKNYYFDNKTDGLLAFKQKILNFKGLPKIVIRNGSSKYGEQMIFQFLIDGEFELTDKRTKHNTLEIYFPKEAGIDFLKQVIKDLEVKECN